MAKIPAKPTKVEIKKPPSGTPVEAIQRVDPVNNILAARPAFLQTAEIVGTEELNKYLTLARFKLVQAQSTALLETFNLGDVLLSPTMDLIAPALLDARGKFEVGTPFHVIPIAFFEEWCVWNDIKQRGKEPAIRERSTDPDSEIAKRAKVAELREEIDPRTGYKTSYVEHLNFVCMFWEPEHPLHQQIAVLGFSRASHKDGRHLARLIHMRNASPFACVFRVQVKGRSNEAGSWCSFEMSNPVPDSGYSPWVEDETLFETLSEEHKRLVGFVKNQRVRVNYDDEDLEAQRASAEAADETESDV